MSKSIRFIGVAIFAITLCLIACQKEEEPEYQSIYEKDLDVEKIYNKIDQAETSWIKNYQITKDTGDFGAILEQENQYRLSNPPLPGIGIRPEGGDKFLDSTDRIDPFSPFELVVRAQPEFAQEYPAQAQYRIDRLRIVLVRPGLIPLDKEYSYGELMERLDLRNQDQGEYIYTIDPFDISYNPTGVMVRVYVKGVSRIDNQGNRERLDVKQMHSEFTVRYTRAQRTEIINWKN